MKSSNSFPKFIKRKLNFIEISRPKIIINTPILI